MKTYEDFWYETRDKFSLYARNYTSAATQNNYSLKLHAHGESRPYVLCLPGLTRNSKDFAPLCDELGSDYEILSLDFRGRGRSDYDPDPSRYQPLTYALDTFELIDKLSLSPVILIGTSLGGLVSMLMAAQRPSSIAAIILNDIGPEISADGLERIKTYLMDNTEVSNWQEAIIKTRAAQRSEYPNFTERDWQRFTENLYKEDSSGKPILDYDQAIADVLVEADQSAQPADLWPIFKQLKDIPVLAIRGELSTLLSEQCLETMKRQHPNFSDCTVRNRGHAPILNEPECLNAIKTFLMNL